jgi:hypothetical protein
MNCPHCGKSIAAIREYHVTVGGPEYRPDDFAKKVVASIRDWELKNGK